MRIAIASSGLGHVARGIETWAGDTAVALAELFRCQTAKLSSDIPKPPPTTTAQQLNNSTTNPTVTLFAGAPLSQPMNCQVVILPCLQRGYPTTQQLSNRFPKWAWRWGLKSTYDLEQWSFWWHLWPKLRHGAFDIAHVQDPWLARLLEVSRRWGLHKAKVILAHGTEEPLEFLEKFEYVQHLAPWHLSEAQKALCSRQSTVSRQQWTAMPNFVDCAVFHPVNGPAGKEALRASLGLPPGAFIVGCVAAVKKGHKRIDYLIREFSQLVGEKGTMNTKAGSDISAGGGEENSSSRSLRASVQNSFSSPYLLIAGAKTDETAELLALAESLIPGHYKIVTDCNRSRMPDLYRAMDVFVLTSLFEMMPIALLEALASGLPCLVNTHPVLEWMIGTEGKDPLLSCPVDKLLSLSPKGSVLSSLTTEQPNNLTTIPTPAPSHASGLLLAMSQQGALAQTLAGLTPEWITLHGRQARERALQVFSTEAVINQYLAYYKGILGREG